MATPLPTTPCLVCGQNQPKNFSVYFDGYLKLFRCRVCSFVAQYPGTGQNTIVEHYDDFYTLDFVKNGQEFQYPERQRSFEDMAARIKRVVGSGAKLLDVGSGEGHFLTVCEKLGFKTTGIEPSVALANYSKTKISAEIINDVYAKKLFPAGSFDVITFIQVLEHLTDPAALLNAAYYHLRPGGFIAIEVPSIWSPHFLAYRLTRIKWFVKPPTGIIFSHVSYFSPVTLERLLTQAGFKKRSLVTGRWQYKYSGLLGLIGKILDPVFNLLRIGGIFYLGVKPAVILSKAKDPSLIQRNPKSE